jgi:hypothetical protein
MEPPLTAKKKCRGHRNGGVKGYADCDEKEKEKRLFDLDKAVD